MSPASTLFLWCAGGGAFATGFLFMLWMLRCEHAWEVVVERELPSRIEEMRKHHGVPVSASEENWAAWGRKTLVVVIKCGKCGALKTKTFYS